MENNILREFILHSLSEDVGNGDHSSLACIPENATGKAKLLIKEKGILAGISVAGELFSIVDKDLNFDVVLNDGSAIAPGDVAFYLSGRQQSIL